MEPDATASGPLHRTSALSQALRAPEASYMHGAQPYSGRSQDGHGSRSANALSLSLSVPRFALGPLFDSGRTQAASKFSKFGGGCKI